MSVTYALVALAPNPWDGQWVNRQQLLSRLARKRGVLYSMGAWSLWDRNDPEWQRARARGTLTDRDGVSIDAPPRWLLRWPRLPAWDKWVIARTAARWRAWLGRRSGAKSVSYLFHPAFLPYVDPMQSQYLVYHAYDRFDCQPGWNAALEAAERELLRRADLVIASSAPIAEGLAAKLGREIRVLTNGADVAAFRAAAIDEPALPVDLASIPRPRIGYVGSLHPQIDYGLIRAIALERPDYHWVLIGPRQREHALLANPDFVACMQAPNVHYLGERHRHGVASYVANMDVNVMVYRMSNESWTAAGYPLKLHEYLACGKPVVSVPLPVIREFGNVIDLVEGAPAWVAALDRAIAGNGVGTTASRQAAADGQSWDARVEVLDQWLLELCEPSREKIATAHQVKPGQA